MRQVIHTLAYWLVPPAVNDAIRGSDYSSFFLGFRNRPLLQELKRNRRLLGRHRGARCFVLANGPSVLKQDLLPLRDEVVLSVSNGYLHKDFDAIAPAYHFVPPIPYGKIKE